MSPAESSTHVCAGNRRLAEFWGCVGSLPALAREWEMLLLLSALKLRVVMKGICVPSPTPIRLGLRRLWRAVFPLRRPQCLFQMAYSICESSEDSSSHTCAAGQSSRAKEASLASASPCLYQLLPRRIRCTRGSAFSKDLHVSPTPPL